MAEVDDLTVFFHHSPRALEVSLTIGWLTAICLTLPVIDNIFLLINWDLVLWVHQHWLEVLTPFETNLYSGVPKDLFERLTQTWKIGTEIKNCFLSHVLYLGVLGDHFFLIFPTCQSSTVGTVIAEPPYLNILFLWLGCLGPEHTFSALAIRALTTAFW